MTRVRDATAEALSDLARLRAMASEIESAARDCDVPSDILAGVISHETRGRDDWCLPPPRGTTGDHGHGHGPGQIDDRSFPAWCARWRAGQLTRADGIRQAAFVLREKANSLGAFVEHPEFWRWACAAYNAGQGRVGALVRAGRDPDDATTPGNYGRDVLERAKVLARIFDGVDHA